MRLVPSSIRAIIACCDKRLIFTALAAVAVVCVFKISPWSEPIEQRLQRPLEFRLRCWLRKDPTLDSRVRIYSVGDQTLNYLDGEDLSLREWAEVIRSFAPSKPRAVLIDKIFGTPLGIAGADEFVREIKALDFPVIVGAFTSANSRNRHDLPLDKNRYRFDPNNEDFPRLPLQKLYAYGPHPKVRDAFRGIGHLMYLGDDFGESLIRLTEKSALPIAPLLTAGEQSFSGGKLVLDGQVVPTDSRGRILVNFLRPESFYQNTFALWDVIQRVRAGKPGPAQPEGAVIVLLPKMFTGHTDMVHTPFGTMPGGYFITSLVQSVVTGKWLTQVPYGWLQVLFFGLLGSFLGIRLSASFFWIAVVSAASLLGGGGLMAFVYLGVETSWLFSIFSLVASSISVLTEKTRAVERKAQRLREELERSEKLAAMGRASASIAHEVKNPLAGILWNAQLAQRDLDAEIIDKARMKETLDLIHQETVRANEKVMGLVKFAREEKSKMEDLDLVDRMRKTVAIGRAMIDGAGVTVLLELPAEPIFCSANPNEIHEVFFNFVQNALYAMRDRTEKRLRLAVLCKGDRVLCEIEDTGTGMPPEVQKRLFEPFFTTKPMGEGTGLGLAICHGILRNHSGWIEVESEVGRGTLFRLNLPRCRQLAQAA